MPDMCTVESELTPEQLHATIEDVKYFLDDFGSTRAVRRTLLEQKSDIRQLKCTIKRLTEQPSEFVGDYDSNGARLDDVYHNDECAVDCIMTDVQFFMETYGSTSNVRQLLASQRKEVIGLQRTVRFLEEHNWRRRQDKVVERNVVQGTFIPPRRTDLRKTVALELLRGDATMESGGGQDEIATTSNTSDNDSSRPSAYTKGLCSYPGCTRQMQFNRLCCRHGGYRMCKFPYCGRRAISRFLCRQHGGGNAQCKILGCEHAASSNGVCSRHAIDQTRNDIQCSVDGCDRQATIRDKCGEHGGKKPKNKSGPSGRLHTPLHPDSRQFGHTTCRYPGCRKWGVRNSEHCEDHKRQEIPRPNGTPAGARTSPSADSATTELHPRQPTSIDDLQRDAATILSPRQVKQPLPRQPMSINDLWSKESRPMFPKDNTVPKGLGLGPLPRPPVTINDLWFGASSLSAQDHSRPKAETDVNQ